MDRVRQLMSACEHGGDVQVIQSVLDQGVAVDVTDDDENTPLQIAAANGHEHVVRLLLMRGAALDRPNFAGWTALMQAARHGHVNVVALLLQNKVDINCTNRLGGSALTIAARGGHFQTVRLLVESGVDLNNSGTSCEMTPLLAAAQQGHDAVLRLLLDRGCDVNYRMASTNLTPLMLAALNGHMTTAQILIERGGDPNHSNTCDKTALEIASIRGKREVRGYLERKTTKKPKIPPEEVKPDIIEAAKNGDIQRVQEILDQDISQRDACSSQDGATPLMFAAMTGRLDIGQLLIDKGCDINKQDAISGWTALMQATYHGKKTMAIHLITMGADVTVQAKNGCTAFDMASLIDDVDTELLRLLAAKTLQVSRPDKCKKSWSKQNGTAPGTVSSSEDQSKNGLKAWWSRMSNRFRNLKLGRTFNLSNRLAPMPLEVIRSSQDLTIKPQGAESLSLERVPSANRPNGSSGQSSSAVTSYETMLLETRKSASVYTLDINPPHSNLTCETLKPVIPPFLPPPTFGLDSSDHTPRKSTAIRRTVPVSTINGNSTLTLSRPIVTPMKFLQSRSTGNLTANHISPSSTTPQFTLANPSPGAIGCVTSVIPGHKKYVPVSSSQSGSITTGDSDSLASPDTHNQINHFIPLSDRPTFIPSQQPESRLFMPSKSSLVSSGLKTISATTSPESSTSGSSSMTPQRSSQGRSTSSKESNTSTLTPSPSPTPGKNAEEAGNECQDEKDQGMEDELSGILKKLSLERYQPIFEEQEVDMEAFLTLTNDDLRELGISHPESRRQILATITELKTGKGKERQQFHDTLASFQSTLKARAISETGSEGISSMRWLLQEEAEPSLNSTKSRTS